MARFGKQAVPAPHNRSVELVTSATLPLVALMLMPPVTSGLGSGTEAPGPAASCTRWWIPGAIEPMRLVRCQLLPAEDAYCTVQPIRLTVDVPRLKSSM